MSSTTTSSPLSPDESSLIISRSRDNLIDFEIATDPNWIPNWHHEQIAQELEYLAVIGDRDYKILLLFVPPRHGKSTQVTVDFASWLLGNQPEKEIITASYSDELALTFGTKTRNKMESQAYKTIFNTRLREDDKSKGHWLTREGGGYTSLGIGGGLTGRGAHFLFVDDPIKNRKEAESQVYRENIWDWFKSTAFTRLEPGGVAVIIMARWHKGDLAGKIIENPEFDGTPIRFKVINFPAIAIVDDRYRNQGDPLWPERFPLESLQEIKNVIGTYEWSALYQGNPIIAENVEFKPEWYKRISQEEVDKMSTNNFLTIDPAMSKKTSADYTGFCDNSVNKENFWHFKAWHKRMDARELIDSIFVLHKLRKYVSIGIEKTAYTEGIRPFLMEEQRKRNVFLPIVELEHRETAKEIRIRGLVPRYSSGSVYHVEGECRVLEDEQQSFPSGQHDDVVDAAAYMLQLCRPPADKKEHKQPDYESSAPYAEDKAPLNTENEKPMRKPDSWGPKNKFSQSGYESSDPFSVL